MPTELKLPELGENITTGEVVRVLVNAGETVAKDQPVLELETDKATIEVPAAAGGKVSDVKVKAGDKVQVGQVILTLDEGAGAEPKAAEDKTAETKPAEQSIERAAEGGQEQQVGEEPAARGRERAREERKQKPGVAEKPAPARPTPQERREVEGPAREAAERPAEGPRTRRGEVVEIGRMPRAGAEAPPAPDTVPQVPAAPSVRRFAREMGIDISRVPGSGPEGRIAEEDVKAYVRSLIGRGAAGRAAGAAQPLPDFSRWGDVERIPMRAVRRKTAEHLAAAWATIPHVTQHDRADITALEQFRKRYDPTVEKAGGKLTVTAIAVKVAAAALKVFPQFNASIDVANEEIIQKKYYSIGVAVDTDRGLLVPVIRNADTKNVVQISVELADAAERARSRKITLEEMDGGTFTITNLGGIGGTYFTPIVNAPEVAILGISRAMMKPVHIDGAFEPRLMLPLSLAYDHRAIDGAEAARFLRWIAEALEQPFLIALQG
jgi:pyruvate dehydrogenase E2 component (dihydrolipoamide acetyltransferase)